MPILFKSSCIFLIGNRDSITNVTGQVYWQHVCKIVGFKNEQNPSYLANSPGQVCVRAEQAEDHDFQGLLSPRFLLRHGMYFDSLE